MNICASVICDELFILPSFDLWVVKMIVSNPTIHLAHKSCSKKLWHITDSHLLMTIVIHDGRSWLCTCSKLYVLTVTLMHVFVAPFTVSKGTKHINSQEFCMQSEIVNIIVSRAVCYDTAHYLDVVDQNAGQ